MAYKKDTIEIFREVVASLSFPVIITDVDQLTGGDQLLHVCDIYHVQIGFTVTIDSIDYTVSDFSFEDLTITVSGSGIITATEFELYHPKFFHGTLTATNIEIGKIQDAADKTPMIWFKEIIKDGFNSSIGDPIDRILHGSSLYFLSQADHAKWQTEEAYERVIMPMRRLQENFFKRMKVLTQTFQIDDWDYTVENYAKLGVYVAGKGVTQGFFVDKLAGCEMSLDNLKIRESGICPPVCP